MEHSAYNQPDKGGTITTGHEQYLRLLLLLLQACPVALKSFIFKELAKRNTTLDSSLSDVMNSLEHLPDRELNKFYHEGKPNTNINSWDTSMLCAFIFTSFKTDVDISVINAVKCISEQRKDIERFAACASVDYNTFKLKMDSLHQELLTLLDFVEEQEKFDCKRLIHSFKLEKFTVNSHIIERLSLSRDVNIHVQVAIQENVATSTLNYTDSQSILTEDTQLIVADIEKGTPAVFVKELQDKNIYVNDSVILSCSLSQLVDHVEWKKNYIGLKGTETVKIFADQDTHWLAIEDAQLQDSGTYMCVCADERTTAVLNVTEKPVKIVTSLHVEGSEAIEHHDVTLTCTVNILTKKPVWFHNGTEVISSTRVSATLHGHEHRLTILNVESKDEGLYMVDFGTVTSTTEIIIKGNLNISHRRQLAKTLYRNWVRGALGLKYLKQGLEEIAEILVNNHHMGFLSRLSSIGGTCTQCNAESLLPLHEKKACSNRSKCLCSLQPQKRTKCPNGGYCSSFYDYILQDHRFSDPMLANTDIQQWSTQPWSVAACFISTPGYKGITSSRDIDCNGLISLFINNKFININLGNLGINGKSDVFKKARDARNEILHNPRYQLSDRELEIYIQTFKDVLEAKNTMGRMALLKHPGVKDALQSLNELQQFQIDINICEDLEQRMKALREHSMNEEAEKLREAQQQANMKLQQTEEKLRKTTEELQLMRQLQPALKKGKKSLKQKVCIETDLYINILGNSEEATSFGNSIVYRIIASEMSKKTEDDKKTKAGFTLKKQDNTETRKSLISLLKQIFEVKGAKFGTVSRGYTCSKLRINCRSYEAIAEFIEVLNSSAFEKGLFEIKKSLEKEVKGDYTYTVEANFSSTSLSDYRQKLVKRGIIRTTESCSMCEAHPEEEYAFYCSDHKLFCCKRCITNTHRLCMALKEVTHTRRAENDSKEATLLVNVNTRLKTDLYTCGIIGSTVHPNKDIYLVDKENKKLKGLMIKPGENPKFKYSAEIMYDPLDICCTETNMVVISVGEHGIIFVDTTTKPLQINKMSLSHWCIGLACHGKILYVTDRFRVYAYTIDACTKKVESKKLVFSKNNDRDVLFEHIGVSPNGRIVYIAAGEGGLMTIDRHGNHLSTILAKETGNIYDVSVTSDGTVLVCDVLSESVKLVDTNGERVLKTIVKTSQPWAICYCSETNQLIVGHFASNTISVYNVS